MAKILTTAFMRDLEAQVTQGKITYSRMLELIEEKVLEGYISKEALFKELDKNIIDSATTAIAFEQIRARFSARTAEAMSAAYKVVKQWILNQK